MRATTVTVLSVVVLAVLAPGVALAGGGGACRTSEPREATGDTVAMRLGCFEPNILRTDVGATVTFTNVDPIPHRVVGLGMGFGDLEMLEQGAEIEATFTEPGVYPYVCDLHPGMLGAVVVGDGPALGDDDLAAAPEEVDTAAADGESAMGPGRTVPAAVAVLALAAAALLLARRRAAAPPPQA